MARAETPDFQGNQRFQLVTRIGEGGMGVVYEAIDREQNMRVALKALRTLSPDTLLRFKNEFRALADIQHPNLISFYELIEDQGQWFLSMELVTGADFLAYVRPMTGPDGSVLPATSPTTPEPQVPLSTGVFTKASMRPVHGAGFDAARLRASLVQLSRGLSALHAAGKIHRDIKPANIRVTPQGRVVVLDFGLVRDSDRDARPSEIHVVGTAAYMAPEQAASRAIGPPADWYAVGVLLFESLTGKLPFSGRPLQILTDKQRLEPLPPRAFVPDVPPDLDQLATDLLKIDPAARPDGEAIIRRLSSSPMAEVVPRPRLAQAPVAFVGRQPELQVLGTAFSDVRRGRAVAVVVHGESGVGKTSLVRRFTERLAAEDPGAVILHGRCYERETVPYKAVDGVIDALSKFLARTGRDEAEAVLPRQVALLAQVFPVLRRVEAVAQLGKQSRAVLDPHELRTRVFAAVRELFARLAERRSVILAIDDMQWADADSLALLAEVFRPPDAPPILLLATVRGRGPTDPGRSGAHAVAAVITPDARHLDLKSLPREDAETLARSLLSDTGAIAAVVEEAGGHPLFIAELARHAAGGGDGDAVRLRLDEALFARVAKLLPKHRRLLELVAVAGAPLAQELAAHAAEIEFGELGTELAALRSANFVRTSGARSTDVVEPYHDRVKDAVLGHLDAEGKRFCHERLALAMEGARQQDEETMAAHWQGAGRLDKASQHAATAADQAAHALAFDRAARLYRMALELRGGAGDHALELKLAQALANAGRGKDAAEIYLRAAEHATGHEALELRRIASEQLLHTGHIDRGLEVLERVLAEMGFSLPPTQAAGFVPLLYWRARVRLRGLGFKERDPREVRPLELTKIDVCWSVAASLGMVDHVRSALFQAMNLVRALKSGDRPRIVRAVAVEAVNDAATSGVGSKRAARLVTMARELSDRMATPEAAAWAAFATGTVAHVEGRWRAAREALDRAETLFRDHCRGFAFEIANAHAFSTAALYYAGEYAEMARRVSAFLKQAEDRGDVFTATTQRIGLAATRWLMEDQPARALEEIDKGMQMWSHRSDFHLQHLFALTGRAEVLLYQGDGEEAWRRAEECWPQLVGSHLLRIQYLRIEAHWMRARAALMVAESRGERGAPLLASALADAKRLEREKAPWAAALATLIRAGVARVRKQPPAAITLLRSAEKQLEALDMAGFVAATRRRLGTLIGGTVGDELIQTGDDALTTRDVKAPDRFATTLVP